MSNAPGRLAVFKAVNGRRTAADIAKLISRPVNNVHRDLATLRDAGLIHAQGGSGRSIAYDKVPLARTISAKYFESTTKRPEQGKPKRSSIQSRKSKPGQLALPSETETLEIARAGEDQLYEFKAQGCDVSKVVREIAAMANTSFGGLVFYGIDDDGNIEGSDVSRQKFDQPLQNSIKNSIAPALTIKLGEISVLGSNVLVVIVPPWNRHDVYQFGEKILIRKGTNVFAAKPEEVRKLHRGEAVV